MQARAKRQQQAASSSARSKKSTARNPHTATPASNQCTPAPSHAAQQDAAAAPQARRRAAPTMPPPPAPPPRSPSAQTAPPVQPQRQAGVPWQQRLSSWLATELPIWTINDLLDTCSAWCSRFVEATKEQERTASVYASLVPTVLFMLFLLAVGFYLNFVVPMVRLYSHCTASLFRGLCMLV